VEVTVVSVVLARDGGMSRHGVVHLLCVCCAAAGLRWRCEAAVAVALSPPPRSLTATPTPPQQHSQHTAATP
jgi:hypothetical protein